MYESDTESPVATRKRLEVDSQHPSFLNEYIKCVVVGDGGVGKTCLITTWACEKNFCLKELVKTHVSTVWAHDHYRNDRDILEKSIVKVDGGNVSLRLWDTFGYHDKDRRFAYKGADVVLLCFSLCQPKSLQNVSKIWIPEIRHKVPTTPVVIAGCQGDLRYMYRNKDYLNIDKGLLYKIVQEKDIVTPDEGRAVAQEIGAPYYECSVLNKYGVEDVFNNVIRAAMVEKRKLRFWSTQLRRVQYPQIQAPMKPPPLYLPKVTVPPTTLHNDLYKLLFNQSEGDVVFNVRGQCFRAHKICLTVSAKIFEDLFTLDFNKSNERKISRVLSDSSQNRKDVDIDVKALIENEETPTSSDDSLSLNDSDVSSMDIIIGNHPAFALIEPNKPCDNPYQPGEVMALTCVTLNSDITPRGFQYVLEYLYTGKAKEDFDSLEDAKVAAHILQLLDLSLQILNIQSDEAFLNTALEKEFLESRKNKLRDIALKKEFLADIKFKVDDGTVPAHKPLLMARCEMMYAMFNDNFMEASADVIHFPGTSKECFLALREFLYTDDILPEGHIDCLGVIEIGNRFCLPRLVKLVEASLVEDLTIGDGEGEDILEEVLHTLEPAQLHNADGLSDWCLKYLCNHYLQLRQRYMKMFQRLNPDNIKFIEKNKWPPEWYIKELNYYENAQNESLKSKKSRATIQQKQQFSRVQQCSNGCLCFCRRSRLVIEDVDSNELPA